MFSRDTEPASQHALVIGAFADVALNPDSRQRDEGLAATVRTQDLLHAVWRDIQISI